MVGADDLIGCITANQARPPRLSPTRVVDSGTGGLPRVGDRVRVIDDSRPHGCRVGDTGCVVWTTPRFAPAGVPVFIHCEMGPAGSGRLATFRPGEVERAT
jgi:hypothetical protein